MGVLYLRSLKDTEVVMSSRQLEVKISILDDVWAITTGVVYLRLVAADFSRAPCYSGKSSEQGSGLLSRWHRMQRRRAS